MHIAQSLHAEEEAPLTSEERALIHTVQALSPQVRVDCVAAAHGFQAIETAGWISRPRRFYRIQAQNLALNVGLYRCVAEVLEGPLPPWRLRVTDGDRNRFYDLWPAEEDMTAPIGFPMLLMGVFAASALLFAAWYVGIALGFWSWP